MLVERGLKVMNVEVVGDAYAIASSYLRKTGAIPAAMRRCSKSSCGCSTAANATGFASPTRRLRVLRPNSPER